MLPKEIAPILSAANRYVDFKYDVQVGGLENVPKEGPAILFGNHRRIDDSFIIWSTIANELGRPLVFGTISDVFHWPLKSVLESMGHIPIDQRRRVATVRNLREQIPRLMDEGGLFYIFPEGTTPHDGLLHGFYLTAAQLALDTGVPLVPDGIRYERQGHSLRTEVDLEFGEPLLPDEYLGMNRWALTALMKGRVASLSHQEMADDYSKDLAFKILGKRKY